MRAYVEEGLDIIKVLHKPRNKFYVLIDKGWLVVLPLLVLILLFYKYLHDFVLIFIFILLVVYYFFYFFYVQIGNLFRSENIMYNILGKIHFHNDFIEVLNKQIDLFEISNIEITTTDFEGKNRNSNQLYFPNISLGINNYIVIRFKNGMVEKHQFKLINETQLSMFRKELVHYYKLGLIRELNLHEILGNHSFESKRNFRNNNKKYDTYFS